MWIGSYEQLRNFVECVAKLNGKWTSPGGSAKKFTCCSMDLSITRYPGKQNSLILNGEKSLAVTEMLINVCKLLTNGERTEGTKLSSNGNGGLLVNVRESNSVSANAVNSINSRETAMTPIVEVLAEMPTTSQARVFIPPRTTAKTLVAAGHVNPQILGVIRIIASLGT